MQTMSEKLQKAEENQTPPPGGGRVRGFKPGQSGNPAGKKPGTQNKVTKTLKAATMEAFDRLGGVEWLVKMGEGTTDDRRAFMTLLAKILPAEINANVQGGIQIQLGWLSGRQIGTVAAQPAARQLQVIDVEVNSDGVNRITDQRTVEVGGADLVPGLAAGVADPPSPLESGAVGQPRSGSPSSSPRFPNQPFEENAT